MLIATAAPSGAATRRDTAPLATAVLFPVAEVDLDAFAARAVAWSAARREYRSQSQQKALAAAATGREAEAERVAAAEAARIADEAAHAEAARRAASAATTTTVPTTTVPTTTVPTTTVPTTTVPTTTAGPQGVPGGATAAQWESLRRCESGGSYSAVSSSGRYRGAYQFSQGTWDWVASFSESSLIGVDPAAASSAEQDALAFALWKVRGWTPWPACAGAVL